MKSFACAAIRRNPEGKEWIDTLNLDSTVLGVKEKVEDMEDLIPQWAKANPVVRIVTVEVREVKE